MELIHIIVLGLVQGITEFLPVSSDGHLIAARLFFNIPDTNGLAVDGFLHLGTLLAALVYYRRVWVGIGRGLFVHDSEGNDKRQLLGKLLIASIPAAIIGYLAEDLVANDLRSVQVTAAGLVVTAAILLASDFLIRRQERPRATTLDAFLIGLAQVAALLPGVSRSGTTIAAGRARGLSRSQAVHFSFLMSVPIIAGASIWTMGHLLTAHLLSPEILTAGLITSFVAGLAAIHFLVRMVEKISFVPFAIYLFVLASALILLF
ncbi:MAG: undecaprenyl-diphosphate phosphatase [Candidatus Andersenbacteria bacterium]|nr:undecaprenyl-diphosphate phosphatase [Candidatus Andersenbacteria bacterium]MBI3250788.1 undecaprenyl-diphosphate phosphatase [Candidatus Andersenbacteria bacterium]